jgi:DNA repair protein SbcC/Rad50
LHQVQVALKETREAHEHNRNLLENLSIQLTDLSKRIDKKKEEQVVALKYKERIERSVSENAHSMRAALQPGAACPVCGSVDHPYAHGQHQPLNELAKEAQLEFDAACRAVELLQSESSRVSTEAAKLQVNLGHQRQQLIEFESQEKEYSSSVSQLCVVTGVSLNESHSALDIRLSDLNCALSAAKESLKSAERTQSELRQIVQHHEQMERSWEKNSQEHAHIAQELRLQQEKLGYTCVEIERIANELRQLFVRLDVVGTHAEWQSQFLAQPAEYREKSRKDVAFWFSKQKEIDALSTLSAELKNQIEVFESSLSDKKQIISDNESQLTRLNGQLETITSELTTILNGVSASEFESRLNSIVTAKEKERDTLQRREQEQQIFVARLETQRASLDARQKELAVENDKLTLRLNDLAGVLAVSWSQAPLPMWLAQLEPQLERDLALELKLRGTLEADEQAKQQSASLLKTVDSLEHDLVRWRALSELVGCSTGAKFRKEAHRLTLEVLLTHANYHLESFARRYQLRIPAEGQGLLLEDCDAGGELRSVYSLSGGESFLVSLALAMGLASLSAEQIPVESLFIDEGFGSLDSESLKVALDALDALQAHGRKVGVISHVPEMAERIGVHIEVKPEGLGRSRVLAPQANTFI